MSPELFSSESKLIASRNVNDQVLAITASWRTETDTLTVSYFTDRQPTEDDAELCELTCGELIAAFPDVQNAATSCVPSDMTREDLAALPGLVYLR